MADRPGKFPPNNFKQALARGERQVGLWCSLASPVATEIAAGAGFDWIVVDGEHGPNDITTLLPQLQAMQGGTAEPVFRIPWNEPVIIKRALDVGARSLLIPWVQNADEARRAVASTRYPPQGIRGVARAIRANDYGRRADYHRNAHLDTCVLVQLETRTALSDIEAVAAVDGVDGIFIGPSDVSASLGHLGDPKHPEVQAAIKDAVKRIRAAGKSAGFLTGDRDEAEAMFDLGFNFTAVGNDVSILSGVLTNLAAHFRKQ